MSWRNRAIAATGFAAGAYFGVSALMARGLTRARKIVSEDSPASVGLPYENVIFPSRDGAASLSGWLIPPPGAADMREAMGRRWIVILHGHGSNRADPGSGTLSMARDLSHRGFGLFMFDMRASGDSTGGHASAGFYERFDLLGALDYLAGRGADRERVGALGRSLGGAVALMVSGIPGAIGAVVADSSFADLWMMISHSQEGPARVFSALNPGMSVMARLVYGIDIADVSPARSLSISDTPALLIHGEEDEMVPLEQARLLARAAGAAPGEEGERLWTVPGAGHLQAYRVAPGEYIERVTRFFEESLPS